MKTAFPDVLILLISIRKRRGAERTVPEKAAYVPYRALVSRTAAILLLPEELYLQRRNLLLLCECRHHVWVWDRLPVLQEQWRQKRL